ncbi:MAG: fibronectin type III domain-containing protein [Opitutae bacterium]|nr:fibronectin type III domain-containing protein [Opitutae bacterium]
MNTLLHICRTCALLTGRLLSVFGFAVVILATPLALGQTPPPDKTFADQTAWWADGAYHVIKVTNLNTDTSAGSWRWALAEAKSMPAAENKIILFEVGGKIDFSNNTDIAQARIRIADLKNTYIAGESAPSPGISIVGVSHSFRRCEQVIFRHIRFRLGLPLALKGSGEYGNSDLPAYGDVISIEGERNSNGADRDTASSNNLANDGVLFDHCEFSWGLDETIQIWYQPNRNISFVNCFIYDGFRYAQFGWRHPDSAPNGDDSSGHSMGMILATGAHDENGVVNELTGGNKRIDIQHSVFGNFQQRAPWLNKGNGVLLNGNLMFHGSQYAITLQGPATNEFNSYYNFVDNLGIRTNSVLGGDVLKFGYWWVTPGPGSMIFNDGNLGLESPATAPGRLDDLGPRTSGWHLRATVPEVPEDLFEDSLVSQMTPAGFARWTGINADQRLAYLHTHSGARPADLSGGVRVDPVSQAFVTEVANRTGTFKDGPPSSYPLSSNTRVIADSEWNTPTALESSIAQWRASVEDVVPPPGGGDATPPSVPSGLSDSGHAPSSFVVSWNASTDNVNTVGYEVFVDDAPRYSSISPTITVSGLSPDTTYAVKVRARDAAGNWSGFSSTLNVTTLAVSTVGANIISVSLTDVANALVGSDVAGAVPSANWNNSTEANQTLVNVNAGNGAPTTADFVFSQTAFYYSNDTVGSSPDVKLMRGQRGSPDNAQQTATVAQVPFSSYDVYVYWGGRASTRSVPLTMAISFRLWDGSAWVTNETKFIRDTNRTWDGSYNESTATTAASAVDGQEYVVFRNVTASTFLIHAGADIRAGISGIQIVESSSTTPADNTPPSAPGGLTATGVTATSFSLSWNASIDDTGVSGYEVTVNGVARPVVAGTSTTVSGLSPSSTYNVTVRARDVAGNWSPLSAAIDVTTSAPPSGGENGRVLSINMTGPTGELSPTDIAGVVPAANWNNSIQANQALADIIDSTGSATTADFASTQTDFAYDNDTQGTSPDVKMMRGQRSNPSQSSQTATVSQIRYSTYDVYVYWGGRASTRSVPLTMAINFRLWNGSAWAISETKYLRDNNRVWDGIYNESTASTAAEAVDGKEYAVFRNVTASTFSILSSSDIRAGISGIQIVEQVETPAESAPVFTSASSSGGVFGVPFTYLITAAGNPTSFAATGLPPGLSLDSVTGTISGVPLSTGIFNVALSASNSTGTGTASLAIQVGSAAQSINFPNPGNKTYGAAPFLLGAVASSGLPVVYSVVSGPGVVNGDMLTIMGAGSITVLASQAGGSNHLPAAPVEISFAVNQAEQVITFSSPGTKVYGTTPFALGAVSSSGLPVSYSIVSGPAELAGSVITLTGVGLVTVAATQSGDANHLEAEPVSVSFDVAPASAQIELTNLWQLYDGQSRSVTATTVPEGLAVDLTYDGSLAEPIYPKSYEVAAVVADPNYSGSANATLVVAAAVTVRHAPTLNGAVEGSVQILSPESLTLNGSAAVVGDVLIPGTPTVRLNGQPLLGATIDGPGAADPLNHTVTLNGRSRLSQLVRRIDPSSLTSVELPPLPAGTRNVVLNNSSQDIGDFATLCDLTLNGDSGLRAIPPGTYGAFTANGHNGLILGVDGSTEPTLYHLQSLTLNGQSSLKIVGPVVLTLANGPTLNGNVGKEGAPEWLILRIASGSLTLNGGVTLNGLVDVPNGTVTINGNSTLTGIVHSDRLVINGNGRLIAEGL